MTMTLRSFARWYLSDWGTGRFPAAVPPGWPAVRSGDDSSGTVLFRHYNFQVELVHLRAGYVVPPHMHPNVSSLDVHLCGDGETYVDGVLMPCLPLAQRQIRHPLSWALRLGAGVPHWGRVDSDTSYLSIQEWHNGVPPSFITDDWENVA